MQERHDTSHRLQSQIMVSVFQSSLNLTLIYSAQSLTQNDGCQVGSQVDDESFKDTKSPRF